MAKMLGDDEIVAEVGEFVEQFSVLFLASVDDDGNPEASHAPFVRDESGNLYIFISMLAKHSQNLAYRAQVSVLLLESEDAIVFVARYNGKVVGMCSIQILISTAEGGKVGILEDLVVDRDFRCKGIGTKLLLEAERYCKENGLLRLSLLADKDNIRALEFYKSRGWKFTNLICLRKFFDGDRVEQRNY